jgi:pSer/pThr/pTyr-binding forkhead associated (FHA) protein
VVSADREQFERNATPGLSFPFDCPERRFALEGSELRIGKRRGGAAEPGPEIDLAGPFEDPGVSRRHAVLRRQDDGGYAVIDTGSTNGTIVNDRPICEGVAARLAAGDRIQLGAWTTITVRPR